MTTIFWKEFRENLKWGALGLILFSLGLVYAWGQTTDPYAYDSYAALLSPSVLLVTTLGSAVIGTALGLLQVIPEQARDRWAFLVHRPVSMGAIFAGKCLAGAILYFAATIPPFLFLGWWASLPGNLASPFEWDMALGGIANIICGFVFYLAGIITGMRKGRWWGSRALAIPAGVCVLDFLGRKSDFASAVVWAVLAIVLFLVAAWCTFLKNGQFRSQPLVGRVVVFLVLFYGGMQLLTWFQGLMEYATRRGPRYAPSAQYQILNDGTPIKAFYKDGALERLETLDGKPFEMSAEKLSAFYDQILPMSRTVLTSTGFRESFRYSGRYVVQMTILNNDHWYFAPKRALFTKYNRISGRLVGALTQGGYVTPPNVPSRGFDGKFLKQGFNYYEGDTPIFGDRAYLLDPIKQTTTLLYEGSGDAGPRGSAKVFGNSRSSELRLAAVFLDGMIKVYDRDGTHRFDIPRTHDPKTWSDFDLFTTPDASRFFLFVKPGSIPQTIAWGKLPTYFEEYDANGVSVTSKELAGMPYELLPFNMNSVYNGMFSSFFGRGYYALTGWWEQRGQTEEYKQYAEATIQRMAINSRASSIAVFTVSAFSALLALYRMRGQAMPVSTQLAWAVVVFVTGIAGLLAFIAARANTARVACTACQKPRLIDRDTCEHCGSGWKKPEPDRTSILTAKGIA